jgi:hypothetical protein
MTIKKSTISYIGVALVGLNFLFFGCSSDPFSSNQALSDPQEDEPLAKTAVATVSTATIKLTITTDGHGVTYPTGTVTRPAGAYNWITTAPKNGYEFSTWTVTAGSATFDNAKEATTRAKLGTANTTVKAVFKAVNPTMYKLTLTNDGHGTTIPRGVSLVNIGQTIYIGGYPAKGYAFSSWTVTSGKATIVKETNGFWTVKLVSGNATVKANFKAQAAR